MKATPTICERCGRSDRVVFWSLLLGSAWVCVPCYDEATAAGGGVQEMARAWHESGRATRGSVTCAGSRL